MPTAHNFIPYAKCHVNILTLFVVDVCQNYVRTIVVEIYYFSFPASQGGKRGVQSSKIHVFHLITNTVTQAQTHFKYEKTTDSAVLITTHTN